MKRHGDYPKKWKIFAKRYIKNFCTSKLNPKVLIPDLSTAIKFSRHDYLVENGRSGALKFMMLAARTRAFRFSDMP
jgi:hypothetical protein